jgi:predicted ester cyclase
MASEEIKLRIRRLFEETFTNGRLELADETLAENYIDHSPNQPPQPGPAGFKQRAAIMRSTFGPMVFTVENMLAEGDFVCFNWVTHGTHSGEFMGVAPTGKPVTMTGINIERGAGGKIVEHWSQFDMLGMLIQIGVIPLPT